MIIKKMKNFLITVCISIVMFFSLSFTQTGGPIISSLTYDNITQTGVTLTWTTDVQADSKIKWMVADSNYQPLVFTDSIYNSSMVTNHSVNITGLIAGKIYKYNIFSQSAGGVSADSGYFVTQSLSTGKVKVYFNHTVDTTVSTGEKANGTQNFEALLLNRIDSAQHSIDITLWSFGYYTSVSTALINAKNRGVDVRFVYDHTAFTPQITSLVNNGIPVLQREFDTSYSMHNKFWIFDYRNNPDPNTMYLWTGSTNVTHTQFHSDRNNIIVIQDEALCAAYTREFEEMWGSHGNSYNHVKARFGSQKVNNVPHIFNIAGTRMEAYFAPSDSVSVFLTKTILTKPTHSLYFCMLKYTLPDIENAQHLIFNDGKLIKGVFDSSNIVAHGNAYFRMKGHPVPNTWNPPADVYYDPISGLLHHKYMVIDADISGGNKILSTGSFNWEIPAEEGNDENSLTIFDARITNLYYQEFAARFKESGGLITSAENEWNENASANSVFQNYPNPFNINTGIKFYLAEFCDVKISVYDILGCKVNTVEYKNMDSGFHEYLFNGSGLSGGIYFYNFIAGDYSETKRMLLVK